MLSDEQIYECERIASIRHQWHKHSIRGQQITPADDLQWHFARAIEAEVRKQDDELMRQMLEALDDGSEHTAQCITNYYIRPCDCKKVTTITAARARLAPSTEPASNSIRTTK